MLQRELQFAAPGAQRGVQTQIEVALRRHGVGSAADAAVVEPRIDCRQRRAHQVRHGAEEPLVMTQLVFDVARMPGTQPAEGVRWQAGTKRVRPRDSAVLEPARGRPRRFRAAALGRTATLGYTVVAHAEPKPLQQTIAVLSFQAVYRSYQERRNKGGGVDPLKRKLRPSKPGGNGPTDDEDREEQDNARPSHDYRANP